MSVSKRGGAGRRPTPPREPAGETASPAPRPAPPAERDAGELAREICLRQLATRPRTRAELATALRKRGIPDEIADEVLDRYDEVGIVDDGAFAKAWVSSRHHGRGLASRALAGELRRKGVAADEVVEALEELDPGTEEATARALVARRLRAERSGAERSGGGRRDEAAILRRLVGMLARKGYPPGLAIRVVKEALAEHPATADLAGQLDVDAMTEAMTDATIDAMAESGGAATSVTFCNDIVDRPTSADHESLTEEASTT